MLEADKALLNARRTLLTNVWPGWSGMRSSTHMSCTPSCQLRRCWSTRCGTRGRCGPHR